VARSETRRADRTRSPGQMGLLPISTVLPREIDQRGKATQVVFFVDHGDHIDVWRILHGQRDIPAWIGAADEG